ncbi:efflux transporter outer membrane subunit [Pigmentiphaga soli]|uniref:Efflux transporter outer membrane subunit n=1 Tax=Pigmentiphaga soli TaxID=1007095 RepID=A0ABP8GZV1_9BURK
MKLSISFPRLVPLSVALAVLSLAGCAAVGPDYRGAPDVAQPAAFARAPATGVTAGPAAAAWWEALGDAQLNALVADALARSPDLRAARARLRQARASLVEARRNALPSASANAAYVHARLPPGGLTGGGDGEGGGATSMNLYNASFDATWELDLFGGTRRAIEAAVAEADAVQADLADAHVSLAAEVVQAYVDLRDRQRRLELVRRSAELERQMLDLTRQRRDRGVASDLDVERLNTQVETTRGTLIPLQAQIAESLDQLAALTGREPGALDDELGQPTPLPAVPATVAVGDPAALIAHRPDIRAAERRLASQNAQIGERTADLFPKVTLLGTLGFSASDPGHLIRSDNFSWLGVPYLQWSLLDMGRTRARIGQAEAGRDEASAHYESVVLAALRDANTALSRYGHQRDNLASLDHIEQSATRAETLTRQRYQGGTASALDLLDAERTRYQAEQNRVAGQAELVKDFAAVQKSLGLGWVERG